MFLFGTLLLPAAPHYPSRAIHILFLYLFLPFLVTPLTSDVTTQLIQGAMVALGVIFFGLKTVHKNRIRYSDPSPLVLRTLIAQ